MSKNGQNGLQIGSLALILGLTVWNTCQINNQEKLTIENNKAIDEVSQALKDGIVTRGGGGGAMSGNGGWGSDCVDDKMRDALADPNNILVAPSQCLVDVTAGEVSYGHTFRGKIAQDPRGMNPYIANGADVTEYNKYLSNYMAIRDVNNPDNFNPDLALSVSTPDEGLTYTIVLRDDVYWHMPVVDWSTGDYDWLKGDGPGGRHQMVADDFVFVFEMLRNNQVAGRVSALRNYFDKLESMEAVDDHTLKLTFSERQYTNLGIVIADLFPMPRWLYMYDEDGEKFEDATWGLKLNEHWYNQTGIGVGPYQFVRWSPGEILELEANPQYWGPRPAFERILFPVIKDQNAYPRKVKRGELDITQLQPEQYKSVILDDEDGVYLDNENIQYSVHETLTYFYMGWNMDNPMFSDKRVRQAMTMTLDRQGIIDNVFHGMGNLTTGPFPQQVACYDKGVEPYPFDIEGAKALLEEAGWTDSDGDGIRDKVIEGERVDFEFTFLMYGSSSEYETLASIWREALLEAGVKMTPSPVEWSTMLKKMDEREFDVYSGAWVPGWETDLMQIWHSKEADLPKSSNRIGFRNDDADRIAEALRVTFDEEERTALCHEFHALVHDLQPYTFFYQRRRPVVYWDHLNSPKFSLIYPYRDHRYWAFNSEPARP